eukprot:gene1187-2311_t
MRSSTFIINASAIFAIISIVVRSSTWTGLSYDAPNFMCKHFDEYCETILDDIDCSHDPSQRIIVGCPDYPLTQNDISHWKGICTCLSPIYYDQAGQRITQQLIQTRISPDIFWQLEPFDTGPPYDLKRSYKHACGLLLKRMGCPETNQTITAENTPIITNGILSTNFHCSCGDLIEADKHLNRLLMDKMNEYLLQTTPIFSNPVYLSVPMSIAMVLICGKIGAIIAVYLKLPPIVGFLLAGLSIQNILNPMFLRGVGYPYPSPASELKLIGLIIVLMRAGLAVNFKEIHDNLQTTTVLSIIPYLGEFFVWLYVGSVFFGWNVIDMGLMASIMAPLGPSVIISGLLMMVANEKKKPHGYVPRQLLITTPIEAVLAIVLFGIFSNLDNTQNDPLYPWVPVLSLLENCLLIPYIDWRSKVRTDFVWIRVNKNPQMGSSTADMVFVLLVSCYTMYSLCNKVYIQQSSGVLVVFVACITVSKLALPEVTTSIAQGLKGFWIFAEVFLFTLTGTSLSFDPSNGPLYGQRGLSGEILHNVITVMFIASIARQQLKWLGPFCISCYIFQLPKATVQATMGSVAYYTHIIPGSSGINKGFVISQACAFTVLVFAPLGTILTKLVGGPMAMYLTKQDKAACWNDEDKKYNTPSSPPSDHNYTTNNNDPSRSYDNESHNYISQHDGDMNNMNNSNNDDDNDIDDGLKDPDTIDDLIPIRARAMTVEAVEATLDFILNPRKNRTGSHEVLYDDKMVINMDGNGSNVTGTGTGNNGRGRHGSVTIVTEDNKDNYYDNHHHDSDNDNIPSATASVSSGLEYMMSTMTTRRRRNTVDSHSDKAVYSFWIPREVEEDRYMMFTKPFATGDGLVISDIIEEDEDDVVEEDDDNNISISLSTGTATGTPSSHKGDGDGDGDGGSNVDGSSSNVVSENRTENQYYL